MVPYDGAVLAIRLLIGFALAAHGSQKLFGWFGGYGLKATGGFFESLGFKPGTMFAAAAGVAEFVGGLLLASGFLGPVGPALIATTMLVAIFTIHIGNGFFAANNGYELPLTYGAVAMAIAFGGPGALSLDHALNLGALDAPFLAVWGLIAALAGAGISLALRRVPDTAPSSA